MYDIVVLKSWANALVLSPPAIILMCSNDNIISLWCDLRVKTSW